MCIDFVAKVKHKSFLPQRLYMETRTVVQLNGVIELQPKLDLTVHVNILTVSDCQARGWAYLVNANVNMERRGLTWSE